MRKSLALIILLFSASAQAIVGMKTLDSDYKVKADTLIQITNMPRVRSQDTVGVCGPFVACTMIDEVNCTAQGYDSCESMPDSERCSPLDMSRYDRDLGATKRRNVYNFKGLNIDDGVSVSVALFNTVFGTRSVVKESCAPFDQVVAKVGDQSNAQKIEAALWSKLKKAYERYKAESEKCLQCATDLIHASGINKELKENYSIKASNEEILKAFAQDSYEKFLDKLLIPAKCWQPPENVSIKGNWSIEIFPKDNQPKVSYDDTIKKIKEVLKEKKRPIALNFCAQEPLLAKSRKTCTALNEPQGIGGQHDVIIKGYRKVCNQKNICRDVVQIQNSWGESWQKANDDGWVDAKEILDRTFYEPDAMVWLEKASEISSIK